eukprot:235993_1
MSLSAKKKKNHRSKSLTPSPINPFNQRTCKYNHGSRKIDTSSSASYECADCKSKIKRYGLIYGCTRCKFYLCSPCFRKPSCANGHLLNPGHVGKNTLCSQCKYKSKKRLQMYQCNACKFNMCLGCYSYETCSGNHGLKWQKISSSTHKSMNNCSKCTRIFKINKSLFMCKKCKYSLCGDCYQPSLTLKSRIHRHHKITQRIKSDQNLLMQQQQIQIQNRLYLDEEKKENALSICSEDDTDHEEEEKSIILTDDQLIDHNNRYNYGNLPNGSGPPINQPIARSSRSTSVQSSQSKSRERTAKKGSKKKRKKGAKKKGKSKKKKTNNNGNTPSLSLSGTSEVIMQENERESSSDLDLCGIESIAPSELTRIPSILTDCCICMERDKEVAFLPCGHYIACESCAKLLQNDTGMCAICSMKIQSILKIYE